MARMTRRGFISESATLAGGFSCLSGANAQESERRTILNYNENMEYRRLGKTGLMVSAICLGGHWKRLDVMLQSRNRSEGVSTKSNYVSDLKDPEFIKNRHEVVSRCIDVGINYVDACTSGEILAYAKGLQGRRDKMYLGYSWYEREARFPQWRSAKRMIEGLNLGMKQSGLDYIDLWRISLPLEHITDLGELLRVEEATMEALELAKRQGKARFTGVSTHNRIWLKSIVEQYPKHVQVVLFPYTADSRELPEDSVFDAIKKENVGVFGIKPFADNSLFRGDSSPTSPHKDEDDRRARLALRYILGNSAITAPIPGLISIQQVDNAALAVRERRKLDRKEKAELGRATTGMWANLRPNHRWLKDWEYV